MLQVGDRRHLLFYYVNFDSFNQADLLNVDFFIFSTCNFFYKLLKQTCNFFYCILYNRNVSCRDYIIISVLIFYRKHIIYAAHKQQNLYFNIGEACSMVI